MIWLLQLFLALLQPRTEVICSATSFGQHGDKHGGLTPTLLYKRPVGPKDFGIAHRTWPLGARIKITNIKTGRSAFGLVLDRGTYGMRDAKGWFNSKKRKHKNRAAKLLSEVGEDAYCGCADITYPLADRIGHRGRNKVKITLLKERKTNSMNIETGQIYEGDAIAEAKLAGEQLVRIPKHDFSKVKAMTIDDRKSYANHLVKRRKQRKVKRKADRKRRVRK